MVMFMQIFLFFLTSSAKLADNFIFLSIKNDSVIIKESLLNKRMPAYINFSKIESNITDGILLE